MLDQVVGVGALPRTLVERPKVLNRVLVNVATDILAARVSHRVMVVVRAQSAISGMRVRIESCSSLDPVTDAGLERRTFDVRNHGSDNSPIALHGTVNGNLVTTTALRVLHSNRHVLVLFEATNEGFVSFDGPQKLDKGSARHGSANPVQHEPRRLLSDTQGTAQFVRRNAVLRVHDEPHGKQPFVEPKGRVLEDCPDLDRELTLAALALPNLARGDERDLQGTTTGAHRLTHVPAEVLHELEGTVSVSEIRDCRNERIREFWGFLHGSYMAHWVCHIYQYQ